MAAFGGPPATPSPFKCSRRLSPAAPRAQLAPGIYVQTMPDYATNPKTKNTRIKLSLDVTDFMKSLLVGSTSRQTPVYVDRWQNVAARRDTAVFLYALPHLYHILSLSLSLHSASSSIIPLGTQLGFLLLYHDTPHSARNIVLIKRGHRPRTLVRQTHLSRTRLHLYRCISALCCEFPVLAWANRAIAP